MALPKKPGKSFEQMITLTMLNHGVPWVFSTELMIAIFWEESLFNNVKQTGGSAWGFGQVEPAEFYKFETEQAKQRGYYIHGLPRRQRVGDRTILLGTLTDNQSVKVASSALRHYYSTVNKSKRGALYAYGGVNYKGNSSLTKKKRISIINGWLDCEAHLQQIQDLIHWIGLEDHVIEALRMAKKFGASLEAEYREILFPSGTLTKYPAELQRYLGILSNSTSYLRTGNRGLKIEALQHVVNFQSPSPPHLATDGIFGPQTRGRIVQFQRQSHLQPDGIVGPLTKAKLLG